MSESKKVEATLPAWAFDLLREVSRDQGWSTEETLCSALAILHEIQRQRRAGRHVGSALEASSLVIEFMGFAKVPNVPVQWVAEGSPSPPTDDGSSSPNGIPSQGGFS
jgi:hypothetical protein